MRFIRAYGWCYIHAWYMLRDAAGFSGREYRDFAFLALIIPIIPLSPLIWYICVACRDIKGEF
jgi:hypothetical protein